MAKTQEKNAPESTETRPQTPAPPRVRARANSVGLVHEPCGRRTIAQGFRDEQRTPVVYCTQCLVVVDGPDAGKSVRMVRRGPHVIVGGPKP